MTYYSHSYRPVFHVKVREEDNRYKLFWPWRACSIKRGLEILSITFIDATANKAFHLRATQTIVKKRKGRKPKILKHIKDKNSPVAKYQLALSKHQEQLLSISK